MGIFESTPTDPTIADPTVANPTSITKPTSVDLSIGAEPFSIATIPNEEVEN